VTVSTGRVTEDQVLAVIRGAIGRVLEIDPQTIEPGMVLADDLEADSLALVEIVEIVEEELAPQAPGFSVDDDDIEDLLTVSQAVDYVLRRLVARS
jgi:acyl carrier protein